MKIKVIVVAVLLSVLVVIVVDARIVNSINFTGAKARFDTEAEYRLLTLAVSIVEARRADTDLSLAVKNAYGASIIGDKKSHDFQLLSAADASTKLKRAWGNVAREAQSMQKWLEGRLRPEYSEAFKKVAINHVRLHGRLIEEKASGDYMTWAFEEIASYFDGQVDPSQAIIQCFSRLEELAYENVDNVVGFEKSFSVAQETEEFKKNGLHGHIFQYIAIKAEKPDIFTKDEVFFTSIVHFDIFYEALEQISREAHKHVPGTHDLEFDTFDLRLTPEDVSSFSE